MKLKLYNTLAKDKQEFQPLDKKQVTLYTCGPTVYDYVHIGNLRTYIFEDTLRRALGLAGYKVKHVMNYTDIDDKTIKASGEQFPDEDPKVALRKLTTKYIDAFTKDAAKLNVALDNSQLVRATGEITEMQRLIKQMNEAYLAEDGVYFDIAAYNERFKYGVLSKISLDSHQTRQRVENQDYDKDNIHDFTLWKQSKAGEPEWGFEFQNQDMSGRPGWHIECSTIAGKYLGQPFDIHTGGVDLIFPHHENEIAQAKSATGGDFAKFFLHAEHLQVEGQKMSKSLGNFFTLRDIEDKDIDPLAFRLLVLQAHYRHQLNFTWESLEAAAEFLNKLRSFADRQFQLPQETESNLDLESIKDDIKAVIFDDLNTARALSIVSNLVDQEPNVAASDLSEFLEFLDTAFGLGLSDRGDITEEQKNLIEKRNQLREQGDYNAADELRAELEDKHNLLLNDTDTTTFWHRV